VRRNICTSLCSITVYRRKSRETVTPGKLEVLETKTRYSRDIYLADLWNVLPTACWWMLLSAWTTSVFYFYWAAEKLSSCHQFNLSSKQVAWPLAMQNQSTMQYFNVTNEQNAIFACDCHVRIGTNDEVKHLFDRLSFFTCDPTVCCFSKLDFSESRGLISVMDFESLSPNVFNYTEACHRICSSVLAVKSTVSQVYVYHSCIKQFCPSDISKFLFSLVHGIFRHSMRFTLSLFLDTYDLKKKFYIFSVFWDKRE